MKRIATISVLATALGAASASLAMPGGELGTLPLGTYVCELPGDVSADIGVPIHEEEFRIITASSYKSAGGRGTYLLTGDLAVMTSGPFEGKRYHVMRRGHLRSLDADGELGPMRCVLTNRNNL